MAVYTALESDALVAWLEAHDVGTLVEWRGIETGIENSNFFVTTRDRGVDRRFVLTVFERLDVAELAYYLALMQHLSSRGVPCPAPIGDRAGALQSTLAGKPAALVTRLDGHSVLNPARAHCAALGTVLARLHAAGEGFGLHRPNPRGFTWWLETAGHVRPVLDDARRALLDAEIAMLSATWPTIAGSLPCGPIHADLFRDNALFVETAGAAPVLGGVIDLYFAGTDILLLDLAICLNDWCVDRATGALEPARADALIGAYERERPLLDRERRALPTVLRAAALRFWLSRLDDLHRPRPAEMLKPHDPTQFERLLRARRADAGAFGADCGLVHGA